MVYPWYAYSSITSSESIYHKTESLTNAFVRNECIENYTDQLFIDSSMSECQRIYRQFFNLVGSMSHSDEFPDYIEYLWMSDDIVLSNVLVFRTSIAANSAKLTPDLRPYLSDLELERLAYELVRREGSTEEILINGLLIFGNLGAEKYIDEVKNMAINSGEKVAIFAIFNLDQIINRREQLKLHLRDIYEQTDNERLRVFLDKFVDKRGGW